MPKIVIVDQILTYVPRFTPRPVADIGKQLEHYGTSCYQIACREAVAGEGLKLDNNVC